MIDQKWVHDWARFRAVDKDGDVSEFENKPYVSGFCWDTDSGDAQSLRFDGDSSNWKDSLQERVTEPEAYKHVFENDDCDYFFVATTGKGFESTQRPRLMCTDGLYYWHARDRPVAVASHNYTGCWKESLQERVVTQSAPVCMPRVGEEFEINHGNRWWTCEVLMYSCGSAWVKQGAGHHTYLISDWKVRPIKTQKERVVEKALHTGNFFKEDAIGLNKLYDAGMLIEGGE
jgi:hypothetical protein